MARILKPKIAEWLNILGFRVDWKPARPAAVALKADSAFLFKFTQEALGHQLNFDEAFGIHEI